MKKTIIFLAAFILALTLGGCMAPLVKYNQDSKVLALKVDRDKQFEVELKHPNYKRFSGRCKQREYRVVETKHPSYGYLYIHHVTIKRQCAWNGSPAGFFIQLSKRIFDATDVKKLDETKIDTYNFMTYRANIDGKKRIVSIIEIWGPKENTYIIDPKQKLTKQIKAALRETR